MTSDEIILPADSLPLDHYDVQELIVLRDRINERLPKSDSLDLMQELVLQFESAKGLLQQAKYDEETPLNQKAQIINSAAALLKQLADMQIKLYTSERNKAMEQVLIDLLNEADAEDRDAFLDEYEARLLKLQEDMKEMAK